MLKKKFLPNFQRIIEFFTQKIAKSSQKYGFGIRDPRSGIQDPGPRSGTRKKPIPDPGSRGQKGNGFATLPTRNVRMLQGPDTLRVTALRTGTSPPATTATRSGTSSRYRIILSASYQPCFQSDRYRLLSILLTTYVNRRFPFL